MRISTLLVAVLAAMAPGTTAAESTSRLAFQLLEDGSIIVPVTINGAGPFRFMLDTGSTRTVVSAKLTAKLRLRVVAQSLMVTPSGRGMGTLVELDRLAIGDRDPVGVKALIEPGEHLAANGVEGLIGQDVLAPLIYTIDYVRRDITWHSALDSSDSRPRLPLDTTGGRFMVSLPAARDSEVPLKLVPDSGVDGFVLFARGPRLPLAATPLDVSVLRTLSGHRLVRRVLLDDVHVGGVILRNQTAVIVQQDHAQESLGDGLLPLHVFARVTFHGPLGYLTVEAK
jgi:predicted aspartyl protease